MANYFKARKQKKEAEANIEKLKPQIAQRKIEGAFMRGERLSVAQSRSVRPESLSFDNQAKPRKNPPKTKVR